MSEHVSRPQIRLDSTLWNLFSDVLTSRAREVSDLLILTPEAFGWWGRHRAAPLCAPVSRAGPGLGSPWCALARSCGSARPCRSCTGRALPLWQPPALLLPLRLQCPLEQEPCWAEVCTLTCILF